MAASRTVKIFLLNNSGAEIRKTFEHCCGGEFTPGLHPPASISAGAEEVWRSESDGILTGTEGYVKYDLGGQTVYIYWDNPFFPDPLSGPSAIRDASLKTQVSTQDIEPDCDFEKTEGGSGFGAPSGFEVVTAALIDDNEHGPDVGLFLFNGGLPFVPLAGLASVFISSGIIEDPIVTLVLRPKTKSLKSFSATRNLNLSAGVRPFVPPGRLISLRAIMGLP
jgi:hypothetical protein